MSAGGGAGVVDYLSWSRRVKLRDIPLIVRHCRTVGPVALTALNKQELQMLKNCLSRLSMLAETASAVRLISVLYSHICAFSSFVHS